MERARNESSAMWSEYSHSQAVAPPADGPGLTQRQSRKRGRGEARSAENRRRQEEDGKRKKEKKSSREKNSSRERREASPECDEEGHLVVRLGADVTPRFKILDDIGVGTFGKVLECWDRKHRRRVAVKVVRNVSRYREGAEVEIDILHRMQHYADRHPEWESCCVDLLTSFNYGGHICLCFPLYGLSLYDMLKKNRFRGFDIDLVRDVAFQLFASVSWLHGMQLIHTDLVRTNAASTIFRRRLLTFDCSQKVNLENGWLFFLSLL